MSKPNCTFFVLPPTVLLQSQSTKPIRGTLGCDVPLHAEAVQHLQNGIACRGAEALASTCEDV